MNVTLNWADQLIASCRRLAHEEHVAISLAVVDSGGHLVALARMDAAPWPTVTLAIGKAWTAAAWRTASADMAVKARQLPQFATAQTVATYGSFTPQDGGIPILVDGVVVGAMGASGSTGEHDADLVRRAIHEVGNQWMVGVSAGVTRHDEMSN